MTTTIQLPRQLVNQLLHHAQNSPAAEVCGLIGSVRGMPRTAYPVANTAADPGRRFSMEPAAQIEAMRRMRERGEDLFAIYHSHPSSDARPSAADLELAAYPDALYLIISLNTKGVLEMRGFRLQDREQLQEIPLSLWND